ncbi:transposase [Telmatocola sphagniphila]|uniref:Transposase n=1 Tax=Telmatocola sphagniphila TaxID=1123043 RepID=A0A8E6B6L1_9BACT|nr:transposase [Telmatocola sphagniphila]QVL31355.1 transposase [Telmatocola sphagniphila]
MVVNSSTDTSEIEPSFVQNFRSDTLTEAQAQAFAEQDPLFIKFQLSKLPSINLSKRSLHASSSTLAPFEKPSPKKRPRSPGAKAGHEGHSREKPERIDHRLPCCPDCGREQTRTDRQRTRVIEDIPANLKAEAVDHTLHRDWCSSCKKQVEPKVPDALPACTLGNQPATLSAFLHYSVGTTTRQEVDVFNGHLQLKITEGGLTQKWHRLAETLKPWYEQIWDECQQAAVLNADETGWHPNGALIWLW